MTLRQIVSLQMVRFHEIPPELAEAHVAAMDAVELRRRTKHYIRLAAELKTCPICLELRRLVRDHDWKTGIVRDRICERCNENLGAIENHSAWDGKVLGRRWWKWFFDHSERIAAHLERSTGERYARGVGVALGARPSEIRRTPDHSGRDGGTPNSPTSRDSGAFPPQGGGEGWFCL
jgi:hypothetical protein